MYTIALIVLLLFSGFIFFRGLKSNTKSTMVLGGFVALLTVSFFWFMNFWGEKLWFDELGYNNRFWKLWITKIALFAVSFIVASIVVYALTFSLRKESKYVRFIAVVAAGLLSGTIWNNNWDIVLKYINRISTETTDPILNMNTGFYLFSYPFLKILYLTLLYTAIISFAANYIGNLVVSEGRNNNYALRKDLSSSNSLFISAGFVFLVFAFGRFLVRYGLLFSSQGVVQGPGWTDDNIRLPMILFFAVLTALFGILIMIPKIRINVQNFIFRKKDDSLGVSALTSFPATLLVVWLVLLVAVPMLFQWLKVEPNEITTERTYIENNIEFTRQGFHLNKVEVNEFPAAEEFSRTDIENNKSIFNNIRLWDYRALDAVFKQFQEIRLYYEFSDVDIDRYHIDGNYNEVMISAREMEASNLPEKSQTFINKYFKYTHGYGAVLTKVNEFTEEGLPNLLIRDIPPVSSYSALEITQPEIYYGELTTDFVVTNTKEDEFDYPSGENNIYTNYEGDGGVETSNFWRKLIYGWKFAGTKFLLSSYPTEESRIMMHRQIQERVKSLAPFLDFDDDPYVVLENGKLHWIIDAYTTSKYYPYSEPFSSVEKIGYEQDSRGAEIYSRISEYLKGKNYIRNSVKVTVDAYNGDVNLYVFDENDPLIQVYDKIFPGLLKDKSEMPEGLRNHIRYPADMLLAQGLMYRKYHMTDPTVFYNQEDLWVRATEKYYGRVQPVEPYYIMWEQPDTDEIEFVLMLPFTPKNKQVMIGWIAGMCDGENYGRFLAYKFPKEKRVLGTQQVETKIDQDSYLSGQLTLWDQRGSNVIRGNVLAIPIDETIIYVEPIYLKSQTAAYPELRLVAVMHNDRLSYAETFDQALSDLFTESSGTGNISRETTGTNLPEETFEVLIKNANDAFENYLNSMQQKNFNAAGESLRDLENALNQMSDKTEMKTDTNKVN